VGRPGLVARAGDRLLLTGAASPARIFMLPTTATLRCSKRLGAYRLPALPSRCRLGGGGLLGVSQASGGRPTSCANSRFSPRDGVGACPARSPEGSSGAGVRPCSARPSLYYASDLSTEPVLLATPPPYHDLGPTRLLRSSIFSGLLSWGPLGPLLPDPTRHHPGRAE